MRWQAQDLAGRLRPLLVVVIVEVPVNQAEHLALNTLWQAAKHVGYTLLAICDQDADLDIRPQGSTAPRPRVR